MSRIDPLARRQQAPEDIGTDTRQAMACNMVMTAELCDGGDDDDDDEAVESCRMNVSFWSWIAL